MVCLYCAGETKVTNSRHQKQLNKVWRRRQCLTCRAVFSTLEHSIYENNLVVQGKSQKIAPLQRDKLFMSIYNACKHRPSAVSDATALTDTVLGKILTSQDGGAGVVLRGTLTNITSSVLKKFDNAAYVHYVAFHPL
jgi:transcriptional regulator NrdR family protein